TLVSTVGGASGPLWGTALRRAGRSLGEAESFEGAELVAAFEAALAGVVELGAAQEGDKTMVDALAPAVRVLREELAGGEGTRVVHRRAKHRASGSRRDLDCAALRRARARRRRTVSEQVLHGLAAAGGVAAAEALVLREAEPTANGGGGEGERTRALQALAQVARELGHAAERLRDAGLVDEAEIVEANKLMSEDPSLVSEIAELALGVSAESAVVQATERHATLLAGLGDALLAARAADVRELGRRAVRVLSAAPLLTLPEAPV